MRFYVEIVYEVEIKNFIVLQKNFVVLLKGYCVEFEDIFVSFKGIIDNVYMKLEIVILIIKKFVVFFNFFFWCKIMSMRVFLIKLDNIMVEKIRINMIFIERELFKILYVLLCGLNVVLLKFLNMFKVWIVVLN